MKILTTILLILFAVNSQAGNIYIATSGNDGSGNGSIGNPYLTVGKAASVASYGDIIRPANGTYTFAAGVSIPVGVSIEGSDSANVKFVGNYTNTSQSDALLMLISTTDGTNGNQHISGIGFDGNNLTCYQAIIVYGRSNVKVFNVAIRNFVNSGILFRGTYALGREPTIPATGNELHHATIENCADRTTRLVGAGIVATGYAGLLIHDIVSRQGGRPRLHNGNNFGAAGTNTASGLKIYNSKFYRPPSDSSSNLGNSLDNSFILELWDSQGGMEIYNNEFHGGTQAIDLAGNDDKSKGAYTYGYWIHDNYFNSDSLYANLPIPLLVAIDYEGSGENIIIERNHFKNYSYGVMMTLADVSQKGQRNTTIQNNLFENIGTVNVQFNADIFINGGGSPANAGKITGLNIYNNTHSSLARYGLLIVGLKSSNQIVGFNYINNIVTNVRSGGYITIDGGLGRIDSVVIKNNISYNNALSNEISFQNGAITPVHYSYTSPIKLDPKFNTDFTLKSGSPAIDAGFNVGLPYNGSAPDIGAFETGAAPTVNAGTDQSITVNTASLSGSATGTIVSYLWSKQSGGSATIVTPNSATTSLTGLVNGTYQFKLTATDNLGISASDIVQVIVNIPAPVVNAGVDQSLTASSGTLTGTATDAGTITSTIWTKISGAAGMSFGSPTSLTTTITGLINGVYQFALKATNNNGLFTIDTVKVTVNIAPPVVNAGTDQSIAVSTTTLTGTATGTIASYNWSKISGPSATITSPTSASTGISGLGTGVYLFKLTATNSDGISASDTMKVTVTIPIAAPTISTTDKTITTYSTTLSATATTEVGHTGTYIWTQISGPSASITSATTLTPSVVVTGTGIYVFRARITQDDAQTAYSDLTLTVNIPIPAPTVTTINKTVTTTTTGLTATVTSATGYGVTYLWTQTSGFTATILNPTTLTPTITGLSTGICKFRIFVTQSDGQTAYSDLTLTVSIPNLPPIVSAGANQILYLPTDTTSFSGSVTPASGTTISSTVWTKTSGGTYGMIGAGTLTPTLSGLNGNYVFRLTATQSDTQVAYNELVVSVVPLATTSSWKYPSIIIFENIP